jgi:hypothetical protein
VCVIISSYLNFYNKKEKKFLASGLVKVRVLPPFHTTGMKQNSVNELSKHLHHQMQNEFEKLNKEINLNEKYLTVPMNYTTPDTTLQQSILSEEENCLNLIKQLNDSIPSAALDDNELTASIKYLDNDMIVENDANNNSINEDESLKKNE